MNALFGGLLCLFLLASGVVDAQTTKFQHIVVVVQENRSPDNLFQGLCVQPQSCSTSPSAQQYDIQTSDWLDSAVQPRVIKPAPKSLVTAWGPNHSHVSFVAMCDMDTTSGLCRMDGAAGIACAAGACPPNQSLTYVDNSAGILAPYLALANQYGWANYMFQTNQGPSFPAHQFLFGATSAPSAADDALGIFASENLNRDKQVAGCIASPGARVQLINAQGVENPRNTVFPCFEHLTIGDVLTQAGHTWRYYTPVAGSIWTAPNAINHICQASTRHTCDGPIWQANVAVNSTKVLSDIANCHLQDVSWVIPTAQNSDHANGNTGGGPSWVASIVNAVGTSSCQNERHQTYWQTTAILITWDDWGGWYDHEPPVILPGKQGGYQYGFRVPFVFVSAYTRQGYIDNSRYDFGSIARFIEQNFSISEGILTFADARSRNDLTAFVNLTQTARPFRTIPAQFNAAHFLNDRSPQLPPDDD